jgi:hypothetical protein
VSSVRCPLLLRSVNKASPNLEKPLKVAEAETLWHRKKSRFF